MKPTDYEILFDLPAGEYSGRGVNGIRTVTIRAGRSLEVMCHPIVNLTPEARREAKKRRTSPAMAKINAQNTERHIMRLIAANFTESAVVVTGTYAYPVEDYGLCSLRELADTYEARGIPWDDGRIRMDVRNWLARLRRRVEKAVALSERSKGAEFKWLVRIEEGKEPPGVGLPPKYHFHAVVEGPGLDRDTMQQLWEEKHGCAHCDRLDLKNDGAARLARYFCKQKQGGRWWSHSRNLKTPQPTVSDRRISRRRAARIAEDVRRDGRVILERLYPGYRCAEVPTVRYSDYVSGAYIYARLYRIDPAPPWERHLARQPVRPSPSPTQHKSRGTPRATVSRP